MNADAEFMRRSSELMGRVGATNFMVLAFLFKVAQRVDGQLVVVTTSRSCAAALGVSPTTANRALGALRREGIVTGDVSAKGCKFTLPEPLFGGFASGPSGVADSAA